MGIGCNNFGTDFFGPGCDQQAVTQIVNVALDACVTLFDTAEEYSITSYLEWDTPKSCSEWRCAVGATRP